MQTGDITPGDPQLSMLNVADFANAAPALADEAAMAAGNAPNVVTLDNAERSSIRELIELISLREIGDLWFHHFMIAPRRTAAYATYKSSTLNGNPSFRTHARMKLFGATLNRINRTEPSPMAAMMPAACEEPKRWLAVVAVDR